MGRLEGPTRRGLQMLELQDGRWGLKVGSWGEAAPAPASLPPRLPSLPPRINYKQDKSGLENTSVKGDGVRKEGKKRS